MVYFTPKTEPRLLNSSSPCRWSSWEMAAVETSIPYAGIHGHGHYVVITGSDPVDVTDLYTATDAKQAEEAAEAAANPKGFTNTRKPNPMITGTFTGYFKTPIDQQLGVPAALTPSEPIYPGMKSDQAVPSMTPKVRQAALAMVTALSNRAWLMAYLELAKALLEVCFWSGNDAVPPCPPRIAGLEALPHLMNYFRIWRMMHAEGSWEQLETHLWAPQEESTSLQASAMFAMSCPVCSMPHRQVSLQPDKWVQTFSGACSTCSVQIMTLGFQQHGLPPLAFGRRASYDTKLF